MAAPTASPTAIVDDVERRLRAGKDPVAVISDLARGPRFQTQSAYAVARQSHRERAGDVLELGLLERQRGGATGGHRWCHRIEAIVALQAVVIVNPVVQLLVDPRPWRIAAVAGMTVLVVVAAVLFVRQLRDPTRAVPALPGAAEGTVSRRGHDLASTALGDLPDDTGARVQRLREVAGDGDGRLARYQAAAAFAVAEKMVAGALGRRRGEALSALGAARRAVLADLDHALASVDGTEPSRGVSS